MRYRTLTKNLFTTGSFSPRDTENLVFISYRNTACDKYEAQRCAELLEDISGLHSWLDKDDECMQQAHAENDDLKKARCIERGLDVSSALLGIIGPCTFTSPWIPYEIGGARGRQRYSQPFQEAVLPDQAHPLIAHLIHDVDLNKVPAFVGLGIPLVSLGEVKAWAESVAEILDDSKTKSLSFTRANEIKATHGIGDIYRRNTRELKATPL